MPVIQMTRLTPEQYAEAKQIKNYAIYLKKATCWETVFMDAMRHYEAHLKKKGEIKDDGADTGKSGASLE